MLDRCDLALSNDFASLHWLTALRGDFDPQRLSDALANPTARAPGK